MREPAVLTGWLICGQGCGGGLGMAVSCSGRAGLWGFTPGLSSTFCRSSSFPEGITHAGLALLQGIHALPGQRAPKVPRSYGGQLEWFSTPGHAAMLPLDFFQPDV